MKLKYSRRRGEDDSSEYYRHEQIGDGAMEQKINKGRGKNDKEKDATRSVKGILVR